MNDNKDIYTDQGDLIKWLPKIAENYIDKTTLIFGGTGSGKTTVIEEIMRFIAPHVPNIIVLAPKTSDIAYRRKLPAKCIKEDLTKEKLQKLWDRQFYATKIYGTANDPVILASMLELINDSDTRIKIQAIEYKTKEVMRLIDASTQLDFAQKKSQKTMVEELKQKVIMGLYKNFVRKYSKELLENPNINDSQKIAVEFIDFNPRLCLIIDDCSEKIATWMSFFKKGDVNPFESIFYKNRWNYLTLIFAAHDDKLIDTKLRKNSRITIYTNSQAFVTSINRAGNGFTAAEKKKAMRIADRIFGSEDTKIKTHQKLCYVREDPHPFRYTVADMYPDFDLGSVPLRNLISLFPKKEENIADNPLIQNISDSDQKKCIKRRKNIFKKE